MAVPGLPHHNQLQFNLSVPPMAKTLAVRYRKPEVIKVERIQGQVSKADGYTVNNLGRVDSSQSGPFQFSVLSQDRMAVAVQMAKRDLKNKKLHQKAQSMNHKTDQHSRSPSPKSSRTRVIHSKEYFDRQKKWQSKQKPQLRVKEHDRNRQTREVITQTPPHSGKNVKSHLPATTNSPPTRDTDVYPLHKVNADFIQPADEIQRLQLEMEGYLKRIQFVEEKALDEQSTWFLQATKGRKKDGYLSDEEDDGRRMIRAEEQATRAARNLYNLRQQVRQIQRELMTSGPDRIKHTKKTQIMSKLAAAHRGAVRAIQTFVNQLPHQDLSVGLPSSYQELALLIRQLTQLSTQIKQGDGNQIQEELINMLNRVDKLNDVWRSELKVKYVTENALPPRKSSPVGRQLFKQSGPEKMRMQVKRGGKENKPKGVLKKTFKKINIHHHNIQPSDGTDDRQAALRAGLVALMQAEASDNNHESRPRGGVTWNIAVNDKPVEKKSLILPAQLQAKRERLQKISSSTSTDGRFADPTISANLKAVTLLKNPITHEEIPLPASCSSSPSRVRSRSYSPGGRSASTNPWIPPGSPSRTPQSQRRSRSHSPHRSERRFLVQEMGQDIVKQLFPDEETFYKSFQRSKKGQSVPFAQQHKSPRASRRSQSMRESLVSQVERDVKNRIQPYLDKEAKHYSSSLQTKLSNQAVNKVASNGDILSEMILNDILAETAQELEDLEERDFVHQEAITMQDNPTFENLYQRLEEMEQEQMDIRRRWSSMKFTNPRPRTQHFSTKEILSDCPRSPPAIEVSRSNPDKSQYRHIAFTQEKVEEPLIFTKPDPTGRLQERVIHTSHDVVSQREPVTLPQYHRPKTHVNLPKSVADRIISHRENYVSHLKKISHHPLGRFDPWQLVEEITDHLLDDCLEEVTGELDDLNEAIANHMYKSEFMVGQSQSASQGGALSPADLAKLGTQQLSTDWHSQQEHDDDV